MSTFPSRRKDTNGTKDKSDRRVWVVFVLGVLGVLSFLACSPSSSPVLFLGLDGADWQHLDTYLASGKMPELARLVAEGRSGVLESREPPLSPLLWTTMMTGVSPLEHGILDFTRRDPATGVLAPISSADRRVPAVWNMASSAGRKVGVFGLWATWPPEPTCMSVTR